MPNIPSVTGRWLCQGLSACLALGTCQPAMAQTPPECHLDIQQPPPSPTQTHILHPVTYHYQITYDDTCQLKPIPTAKSPMECSAPTLKIQTTQKKGQFTADITVQCQFKRPGHYFSPPIALEITQNHLPDPQIHTLSPFHLTVNPYIIAENSDKPLQSALELRPWIQTGGYTWLLITFLIGALTAACLAFGHHLQKRKQITQPPPPPPSPIEIFLAEIAKLLPLTPQTLEEYKQYHDRLSNGLRQYLSAKTQIDALNYTTSKLDEALKNHTLPESLHNEIIRLLSASDTVKFTPHVPSQAANLELLRDTEKLAEHLEAHFLNEENIRLLASLETNSQTNDAP